MIKINQIIIHSACHCELLKSGCDFSYARSSVKDWVKDGLLVLLRLGPTRVQGIC